MLKKWFQPYSQGDQNATQHTKNVQEQVIMQKSLVLAELSWSLPKFNDRNPTF